MNKQSEMLFVLDNPNPDIVCNSKRHFPVKHKSNEPCPICKMCDEMIRLANDNKCEPDQKRSYQAIVVGGKI